jgi:hypothetical protein
MDTAARQRCRKSEIANDFSGGQCLTIAAQSDNRLLVPPDETKGAFFRLFSRYSCRVISSRTDDSSPPTKVPETWASACDSTACNANPSILDDRRTSRRIVSICLYRKVLVETDQQIHRCTGGMRIPGFFQPFHPPPLLKGPLREPLLSFLRRLTLAVPSLSCPLENAAISQDGPPLAAEQINLREFASPGLLWTNRVGRGGPVFELRSLSTSTICNFFHPASRRPGANKRL